MKNIRVFSFVVKYFGFLKVIPLTPHVFDGLLRLWSLLTKAEVLEWMDEIEGEILTWEGVSVGMHKYGGLQFDYKKREIGHLHGNGLVDISFNRGQKQLLLKEGRISNHHVLNNTGWISFMLKSKSDVNYVKYLLKISYDHKKNKQIQQNLL